MDSLKLKIKKKQSIVDSSSIINNNELISLSSNESNDLANYLESLKVLIININDKSFDCPGMLSEDKVLQEYEYLNTSQSSLNNKHHGSGGGGGGDVGGGKLLSGKNNNENDEDRSLSSGDKLENNQSISSSNDENEQEEEEEEENEPDGLSEFNFSGRDTPIISGRDTPSSYSHEDHHTRRTIVTSSGNNNQNLSFININYGSTNNNSRLPVNVHKENREDISDKFCKFEINKGIFTSLLIDQRKLI
jgi:hypothetical protein